MEREEQIRQLAYSMWEKEGYPEGRAMEHWLKAETILQSERSETILQSEPSQGSEKPSKKTVKPAKQKTVGRTRSPQKRVTH